MLRNYVRSLVMFKAAPGKASLELVPDLAESLGKSSDGGKTWTYNLKKGLKFEDGTPITVDGRQVRRRCARPTSTDASRPGRPTSTTCSTLPEGYDGPYKDPKDMNIDSAIETPDDSTIVFHLKEPFAGFDYLAQLAADRSGPAGQGHRREVQEPRDLLGSLHVRGQLRTRPRGFILVRNPNWDAATDPNRKALPDKMTVKLDMTPDDVDNQIIAGTLDVDIAGTGVQPAAMTKVLQDPDAAEAGGQPDDRADSGTPRSTRR